MIGASLVGPYESCLEKRFALIMGADARSL